MKGFAAWFVFCTLLGLALLAALIYVGVHFAGKYW